LNSSYLVLTLSVPSDQQEMAVALLADIGYEGFEEKPDELLAYIATDAYDASQLQQRLSIIGISDPAEPVPLADINWNETWETAYDPVYVEQFCQIIAPFHTPQSSFTHTVYLAPKMAFGTGHHATTYLMVKAMRDLDFSGKNVLDMGCGTGVLGILAHMLGAGSVTGIDIDPWSYENATENASLNERVGIIWLEGDVTVIPDERYEVILANINRNVLLADIPTYVSHLLPGGKLMLSGFYVEDFSQITEICVKHGLKAHSHEERNRWVRATFERT